MDLPTLKQIKILAEIVRTHASWITWRLLGEQFVSVEDLRKLKDEGILPTGEQVPLIQSAFSLGRLESLLTKNEWKNLTWGQLMTMAGKEQTPIQQAQIAASQLSAYTTLRGLSNDIERGIYESLSREVGEVVDEAVVKDKVAEAITEGVKERKSYIRVANDLRKVLEDQKRNWYRVATTEMHAARQRGVVSAILDQEDIYHESEGAESAVAIVPDPDACSDCNRLYLDSSGNPKVFKLSELLENSGTNYQRPWRKNAKPVVPPLHANCFCNLRYVPPGWGWNKEGRFTVVDPEKHRENLLKSTDVSKAHELLQGSHVKVPTKEELAQLQTADELVAAAGKIRKIQEMKADDPDLFDQLGELQHYALALSIMRRSLESSDE
jgi:hypothetical protein